MATFGKTSDGANSTSASADNKIASLAAPSSSGTVVSLTVRLWLSDTGSVAWKGVIYSDVAGVATALLAVTDEGTLTSTSEGDQTLNFSGANLISITSGTSYWIGFHIADPGTPSWTFSRDGTASQRIVNGGDVYAGGTDDPWNPLDQTALSGPIDCYVTYTEAGASTIPNPRRMMMGVGQ